MEAQGFLCVAQAEDRQTISAIKLIKIILCLYLKTLNAPSLAASLLTSSLPTKQQHCHLILSNCTRPLNGQSQDTQMKLINSVTGCITNLAQGCNTGKHYLNLHPILIQSSRH